MFKTVTLSNGLQVVLETIPFIHSVSFGIWVKNGSRNEDTSTNGISHFIEHMLFKGTETRTAKDIADEMDQIGGQLNAFTSKEYTCYYVRALDTHFDIAIDILSDMFFCSKFDDGEIIKERNVIIEEINMYEDTPEELVHDILQAQVWNGDSLAYSVLGTVDSISQFDNVSFREYYGANYHQQNTVIAVAGNFDEDSVIRKLEAYFGGFKRDGDYKKSAFATVYTPGVVTKEKDIEQVHICMGLPSISVGSDESYSLAAINTIFGGGMSSRLFQNIREENGLAYSVYSYNSSYADTGLFSIYAALNRAQAQQVVGLIIAEIKRLFTDKITPDGLARAKEQLKSNYLLSLESSSNRMNSLGRSQLMLGRILSPEELIQKIDRINTDNVYALVEKIFNLNALSLAAVGNVGGLDFRGMIADAK